MANFYLILSAFTLICFLFISPFAYMLLKSVFTGWQQIPALVASMGLFFFVGLIDSLWSLKYLKSQAQTAFKKMPWLAKLPNRFYSVVTDSSLLSLCTLMMAVFIEYLPFFYAQIKPAFATFWLGYNWLVALVATIIVLFVLLLYPLYYLVIFLEMLVLKSPSATADRARHLELFFFFSSSLFAIDIFSALLHIQPNTNLNWFDFFNDCWISLTFCYNLIQILGIFYFSPYQKWQTFIAGLYHQENNNKKWWALGLSLVFYFCLRYLGQTIITAAVLAYFYTGIALGLCKKAVGWFKSTVV